MIARNTAFTFKGKAVDVKKLGRELNVRYVLEGSVQRGGNRLRVNVQLIDAETGNHLWADRFDKPIADFLDMQDEIVSRLANALDAQFVAVEARRAERVSNPDAIDVYFQGLGFLYRGLTADHLVQAQGIFERGLGLYPDNVDLLIGVGVSNLGLAVNYVTDDRPSRLASAEAALTRAHLLAPDSAYAHLFLGVLLSSTNRASQGIAECERALAINRNLAQAHAYVGYAKYVLGRGAETEAHVNEALRISPRDPFAYHWLLFVGNARSQMKDYEGAVVWLRRSNEINANYPIAYFHLASALSHLGRLEEARAAAKQGLALNPGFTLRRFAAYPLSDNPNYLDWFARVCDGLRLAGLPEG